MVAVVRFRYSGYLKDPCRYPVLMTVQPPCHVHQMARCCRSDSWLLARVGGSCSRSQCSLPMGCHEDSLPPGERRGVRTLMHQGIDDE